MPPPWRMNPKAGFQTTIGINDPALTTAGAAIRAARPVKNWRRSISLPSPARAVVGFIGRSRKNCGGS
jgi:hypothetical protein